MPRMTNVSRVLLNVAFLSLATAAHAQVFTFSSSAITNSSQITLPSGMNSVVTAVNVGSTSASVVNGITFAGDTGNWAAASARSVFAGNGYSADGATESGGSLAGA